MEDFLLNGKTAQKLYSFAKEMPIFDYHCHLSPKEIYEDLPFQSITQMWLGGDHYKWRAMRYAGVAEEYITGDKDDYEKFEAFAKVLGRLIGNPLHHWAHMELAMYFGVDKPLNEYTAREIFDTCNDVIKNKRFSPKYLIEHSNVTLVATTDDPADDLCYHQKLKDNGSFRVIPTFRPDRAFKIESAEYKEYLSTLSATSGTDISDYAALMKALSDRLDFFDITGCRSSDHSVEGLNHTYLSDSKLEIIFQKAVKNEALTQTEIDSFKISSLLKMAKEYYKHDFVMQLHLGTIRNNNIRNFQTLGADTGFDSPNDFDMAVPVSRFLDCLDQTNQLPRTILYSLNSKDNLVLASQAANFPKENSPGHVQYGSAWWFCDHKDGITEQLKTLLSQGMLPFFVGMLTDSRSYLSYARHDYFRRILCSLLASYVDSGEYRYQEEILKKIVHNVSYYNAVEFFK